MSKETDVKYCVCAFADLLGFANHLEVSAYDLRTHIGKQAVTRLENLEKAIDCLTSEKERRPEYHPSNLEVHRLNDAILVTMDLDDILVPPVGCTRFQGFSIQEISEIFTNEQLKDETTHLEAYAERLLVAVQPLEKLLGIVARLHLFLNILERDSHFPGAKTVVATGFRRRFLSKSKNREDFLSANFALSNAYMAEKELSGPYLFVDDGIVQMLSHDSFARNVLRFAHFLFKETAFNCFHEGDDVFALSANTYVPEPTLIKLFRKEYFFRKLNPSPTSYLQMVPAIRPFLNDTKDPILKNAFYKHVYNAIKNGFKRERVAEAKPPPSFLYNNRNDLSKDVGVFYEFLATGRSETLERIEQDKQLAEFRLEGVPEGDERRKKVMDFLNQEQEVDLETINIEENRNALFQLDQELLDALMPILEGNVEALDYRDEASN